MVPGQNWLRAAGPKMAAANDGNDSEVLQRCPVICFLGSIGRYWHWCQGMNGDASKSRNGLQGTQSSETSESFSPQ